jgi:hypothetical protein
LYSLALNGKRVGYLSCNYVISSPAASCNSKPVVVTGYRRSGECCKTLNCVATGPATAGVLLVHLLAKSIM